MKNESLEQKETKRSMKEGLQNEKAMLSEIYKRTDIESFKYKASRLEQCEGAHLYTNSDGRLRLSKASFCRVRLCPMCAWRWSMQIYANMSRIMNNMTEKEYAFIFLTLAVENVNGEALNATIDNMMLSWNRFTKATDFKGAVLGWYRGLEITHDTNFKSKSYDTYHPHFHCVLAVRPSYFKSRNYLSQEKWTELWKRALKAEYTPIANTRRIKDDMAKVIYEISRYTVKSSGYIIPGDLDLSVRSVLVLDKALDKRRLVAYGGIMRDLHKELNLADEMDNNKDNLTQSIE